MSAAVNCTTTSAFSLRHRPRSISRQGGGSRFPVIDLADRRLVRCTHEHGGYVGGGSADASASASNRRATPCERVEGLTRCLGQQLTGQIEGDQDILTREEVLKILSEQARKGSISAAVALERALRLDNRDDDELDGEPDELDRLLSRRDY